VVNLDGTADGSVFASEETTKVPGIKSVNPKEVPLVGLEKRLSISFVEL